MNTAGAWLSRLTFISIFSIALAPSSHAATAEAARVPVAEWRAKSRSEHQTEWVSVRYITNAGTGRVRATTNSYTELATGLNRRDPATGQFVESKEDIDLTPDGAIARQAGHQAVFAANLNTLGAIQLTTTDGKLLRSHVLGLAYTDAASGKSVLIAGIKDSIGEIIGNSVIYRDAFDGSFKADVRLTYSRAGFEQDVILRENQPSKAEVGMNQLMVRLEAWTDFLQPPQPVKTGSTLKVESDPLLRMAMVDPDLTDETLDFGAMRIGAGSDPLKPDTDGDGLSDKVEVDTHFTSPLEVDTDYDGRSDWQEANLDQTLGYDPSSVFQTGLANFGFNGVGLIGAQGQTPRQALNVALVPSWSGTALQVAGPNPSRLNYSDLEGDGGANLNCREGTIQFWFKPNWSSGTGPGHIARLLEIGDPAQPEDGWWSLSVNSAGNQVRFEGLTNGLTQPHVFFVESFPYFVAGQWTLLTLTYDGAGSHLYLDGDYFPFADGTPPDVFPNSAGRAANGFSIGSNRTGGEPAEGQFEDLKTFNYALVYPEPSTTYEARINMPLANFSVRVPEYINTSSVLVEVDGAPSGSVASAFGAQPPSNPTWSSMTSFPVDLQPGENILWIGLKDSNGNTRWERRRIVLDTMPPQAGDHQPGRHRGKAAADPVARLHRRTTGERQFLPDQRDCHQHGPAGSGARPGLRHRDPSIHRQPLSVL